MLEIIRSDERGSADHGWLKSHHTFSFADYQNPDRIQFGALRVINEDYIAPGGGFDTHPHRDMEIVTYLVEGELAHKDSMGNGSVIRPGELQRMTAGTGVLHSEFNPSADTTTHLLQIWIFPQQNGLDPGYEQKFFEADRKRDRWCLLGSDDGREGSLTIHQDVELLSSLLGADSELSREFRGGRRGFLQVVGGRVIANGESLSAGDGLMLTDERALKIRAESDSDLLLFDLS